MKKFIIIAICAAFVGRIFITPRLTHIPTLEGTYEAITHMLVGFLLIVRWYDPHEKIGPSDFYWRLGWGLAFWELVWFIAQKALKA